MDILQLVPTIYENLILFLLVLGRISTLLTAFVMLRQELITSRMIIALSAVLSIYVVADYPDKSIPMDLFSLRLLVEMVFQVFIGLVSAMVLNIIFELFIAVGQITSLQIGLGMASLIDPRFGTITSLTSFYVILTTIIFLFLNGHLFIIKMIVDSFDAFPVYHELIKTNILGDVLNYAHVIFNGSIMLSMTVIVTLLLTNVSVSIMTKFAPQFNLFSVGINIELVIGLLCIYLTFNLFVDNASNMITECLNHISTIFTKAS